MITLQLVHIALILKYFGIIKCVGVDVPPRAGLLQASGGVLHGKACSAQILATPGPSYLQMQQRKADEQGELSIKEEVLTQK